MMVLVETQEDDELLNRLGWAIEEGIADHQEKQYSEIVKQAKETNKFGKGDARVSR